ncbi:MAG: DUF3604 domain-containing protein [Deltaproteobacteria bacterium]|nr:DUF3604 domain-containing protein [Deltaproteobacteria bacterium]
MSAPTRRLTMALWAAFLIGCGGSGQDGGAPGDRPDASGESVERVDPGRCADYDPLRSAYFGELHLHTSYSMDAYSSDVRGTPDDAYRFARGEPISLPPLDAAGAGTRVVQLERPIDFAAVTDHASYLGPVGVCTRPDSPGYDTAGCRTFRGEGDERRPLFARMAGFLSVLEGPFPEALHRSDLSTEVCGEAGEWCAALERSLWQDTGAAADRWNDPAPGCRFTTFHAYEYTATPNLSKVHRNVVFRNSAVPPRPISWIDHPQAEDLWEELEKQCLDSESGCDVLTIPHNSNLSNGRLFTLSYREEPIERQRELARRRASLEPLAEIFQIKGDSECRNGMWRVVGGNDELCEFEKIRVMHGGFPDCRDGTGSGAVAGEGCQSRLDFMRYALVEGLREAERIGTNPIKLGFVAATDSHNATSGDTEERSFDGSSGMSDPSVLARIGGSAAKRLNGLPANPGGLAGIWAEENSRDSLFDAMKRRETFGTSGPRIAPRFFGGWDLPDDLCEVRDFVARGYAAGVPMGGDLPSGPADGGPAFAVQALRDAGTESFPGGLLQRIQIIKGWAGRDGRFHQAVYEVAGTPENGADVDMITCQPRGPGFDSLCSVWRDPDFDPKQHAVYYARVLENPSCRWSTWQCLSLPEKERPPACSDGSVPLKIQERAWTSPIWYTPPPTGE